MILKIKIIKVLFFLLLCSNISFAQNLEFGKISKEELAEKNHPTDTSAVAAILIKKAKTLFYYASSLGFINETNYEIRLKIYKKEGFSWANYAIPYVNEFEHLNLDNVFVSEITTYNLLNNKIKKTKLKKGSVYVEQTNENMFKKIVTFPNVKEGSVVEFKYKIITINPIKLPDFDIQETIPVNYAEYATEIPVNFDYKTVLNGDIKIEQESEASKLEQKKSIAYFKSNVLNYSIRKSKYTFKNIPALVEEPFVDNIENYRIKIKNELSAVTFLGKKTESLSQTWNDVTRVISESKLFKSQIETKGYFENDLITVVNDTMNETEKAKAVLNHVKNKIKWNKYLGYYPKFGLENAYTNGNGNVSDINLNLLVMLRGVGISAFPVLVSTRDNGIITHPTRTDINYIITKAVIDNKQVLLDATDLNSTLNILPLRSINEKGILITMSNESEEINLQPTFLSKSINFIQAEINSDGILKGKARNTKSDYYAYVFRDVFLNIHQDLYIETIESNFNNIEITDYTIDNLKDLDKTIVETFSFSSEAEIEINDNKIIFNPLLFYTTKSNPFISENRTMPIDFVFPNQEKYVINITIPEGYEIEHLPEPTSVYMHNNSMVFNFNISSDKNKIVISSAFDINQPSFGPIYYDDIRNIFKLYIEKQTESIILKKK